MLGICEGGTELRSLEVRTRAPIAQPPLNSLQSQKPLFSVVLNNLQNCRFLFTKLDKLAPQLTTMVRNLPLALVRVVGRLGRLG